MEEKKNEKEIMIAENRQVDFNAEKLILEGLKNNASVEIMERLLAIRDKLKAEKAKELFYTDMSKLQEKIPIIKKETKVMDKYGKLRYRYAKLESIIEQTQKIIANYGFSYFFETQQNENSVTVICHVRHIAGHEECTFVTVPLQVSEYINDVQSVGAAITYAKRYSFCNIFGITTADEDTDALSIDKNNIKLEKVKPETKEKVDNQFQAGLTSRQVALQEAKRQLNLLFVRLQNDGKIPRMLNKKELSEAGKMLFKKICRAVTKYDLSGKERFEDLTENELWEVVNASKIFDLEEKNG